MGNILMMFCILMFSFVLYTIYTTAVYLEGEYRKATIYYNKKQRAKRNYRVVKKEESLGSRVRSNITKFIDSKKINEQVGYAILSFPIEGKFVNNTKIFKDKVNIGRAPDNDIVVTNLTVSREQCLIVKKGNKFFICNISKTNKTLLNGMPVDNTSEIQYGDIVEMGDVIFRFNDVV